jgi:predicted nuclease with TOPRIM domain
MKNKKFLTQNNDDDSYQLYNLAIENNSNIKSFNNKHNNSQKIKNINNSIINNYNNKINNKNEKENNFSKILRILDEEIKKSIEYKAEIKLLKSLLNEKNNEIKNLKNKVNSLTNNILKIKGDKNNLYQNNKIFYNNFLEIMNNFKQYQNMMKISLPNYSPKDDQTKKNKDIIYTIKLLLTIIFDLFENTNNNISKFNSLKNKMNSLNESFTENNHKINNLKTQNFRMKKLLEQNFSFLKELRNENTILKNRNLNLEKNINLISNSRENLRKNYFNPIRIINCQNNNNSLNITEDNINNISIYTSKTNKTTTDILIEEYQNKENRIQELHKMAKRIYSKNNKIKK